MPFSSTAIWLWQWEDDKAFYGTLKKRHLYVSHLKSRYSGLTHCCVSLVLFQHKCLKKNSALYVCKMWNLSNKQQQSPFTDFRHFEMHNISTLSFVMPYKNYKSIKCNNLPLLFIRLLFMVSVSSHICALCCYWKHTVLGHIQCLI